MMQTIDLVRIAFRKLKAHVYFDKTALHLRDEVVKFETARDFDKKIQAIALAYDSGGLIEDIPFLNEILSSINILSFPKKMKTTTRDDETVISVGNPKEKAIVSELQYFIDMDVCGHILGIMWILAFGKRLDEMCFEKARGNRLRSSLIWNNDGEPQDTPALFEPYFAQYSLWRDGALSCAENLLAHGHDALILTLDLKRFYYRAGLTKESFNGLVENNDTISSKFLHEAVFAILHRYTEVLESNGIDHDGIALPIGFLPSAVLSNWCLHNFDQGILDYWNPSYYGRYVDDIIIVEKIEKGSDIYKQAREDILTKASVIEYYLGNGRRRKAVSFVEFNSDNSNNNAPNKNSTSPKEGMYRVCRPFTLSEKSVFEFQAQKTRIIVLFSDNNSTALLNKFKNEIHENVSEFRLMPEVGEAFTQDDFSAFYRLDNDATINKLRGIKDISMDKYELSKFLGRYRVVSSLVDDGNIKKFTRIIEKMFNDRELIDNYILWERVFEIFITDKDYSGFARFANRIRTAVDGLTVRVERYEGEEVSISPLQTQKSLDDHFTATLNRVLSLLWGRKYNEIIDSIKIRVPLRKAYLDTRMSNKYLMVVPSEVIRCPTEEDCQDTINFADFTDAIKYVCDKPASYFKEYDLLPYFRQAQDIGFTMLLPSICPQNQGRFQTDYKSYIRKISDELKGAPISVIKQGKRKIIDVGDSVSSKLRVAIANVNVGDVSNLESLLKGRKPNREYRRYRALANLVNDAITENANMLVLPENYVPFEWLPQLASKAAREDLAIITGVEHVITGKNIYNFTAVILPFKFKETIPTAAIFFQLKKHYSPEEKRIIEGYEYKAVEETTDRPLYRWHDCYFPVYCCYELASITDRAEFMSWADMVVAVEFNRDINYFGSIVESLSRDLHCYFVQVNTSQYGDSRITQPTKSEEKNLVAVKGGLNQSLLIGEIDIQSLREFQIKSYNLQKDGKFKPTPPGIDVEIVRKKIDRLL